MDLKFFCNEVLPCELLRSDEALSVVKAQNVEGAHCKYSLVSRFRCISQILEPKEFCALQKKAADKFGVDLGTSTLLFRGSDNGFGAAKFHELCDGKGATLTVALTEFGHVVGGFATVPWTKAGKFEVDTSAWLFVARVHESKKSIYAAVSLPAILTHKDKGQQVDHDSNYGPAFGNGRDLQIHNNCNANTSSYCKCTGAYAFTNVCDGVTLSTSAIVGGTGEGQVKFRVVNYEVFLLK